MKKITIGIGFLFSGFILLLMLIWFGLFGPVPNKTELQNIHQQQATRIVSSDGEQLGTFHLQNRTIANLDEINSTMIDALLAIEDIRFYDHRGIDYRALARVFFKTILLQQDTGGGSTLTQQLAKNLYPRSNRGGFFLITDKLREMIIARRLESIYTKDQILELYLNTVSFGEDTFGIEMASMRFFNKPPSDLTITESATLAGLLQATTFYNPHRNPERSTMRRNLVIRQMERYDFISNEMANEAIQTPLSVHYNRTSMNNGIAPYFREHLRKELLHIFENEPALDEKKYHLNTDGLTIHTTLDSRLQRAAEKAVSARMHELQDILDQEQTTHPIFGQNDPDILREWEHSHHYRQLIEAGTPEDEIEEILHTPVPTQLFTWEGYEEKTVSPYDEIRHYLSFLNAGFVAIHPQNGRILAWVGGIDYGHFQYDQVTAHRQPGSAFKPVLYSAALESGRTPCDYQRNYLATFANYDNWTPKNDQEEYGGRYSLQASLAQSINTVAVQVALETGIPNVQKTASAMGLEIPLTEAPSIALGTTNVSLLDLATAYTSFLNEGKPVKPVMISKIYNSDNELIYDFTDDHYPMSYKELNPAALIINDEPGLINVVQKDTMGISPETAATMVAMLQKAVDEGTGRPLREQFGIKHALAGKTGTTQNYTDGWFIGLTPELVFGSRVGGANHRVRFKNFPAYASQTALPIAGHFLNNISENDSLSRMPDSFLPEQIDSPYNMQCPDDRRDRFGDRLKDFFTGKSSDEPRVIGAEEDEEEKGGNIFQRLGRKLGISGN